MPDPAPTGGRRLCTRHLTRENGKTAESTKAAPLLEEGLSIGSSKALDIDDYAVMSAPGVVESRAE